MDLSTSIKWKLCLRSSPEIVYEMLNTDAGRARFWAESAVERDGSILFRFPNGATWTSKILERRPPYLFKLRYYGGSTTSFLLTLAANGGTILQLTDEGVEPTHYMEVHAGWVSVLMALKAAVDFDVDLRNHDINRTWDQYFVDN